MKTGPATRSAVRRLGGAPAFFINDEPFPAAAYMTYLGTRGDYAAFATAGYRLFSVPVLFAGRWINSTVEAEPFMRGVFDTKDAPDYTAMDASVRRILAACPEAYVFPRLNISMPLWWIEEHSESTDGTEKRESLYADAYRNTAEEMLRAAIRYLNKSDYADRIAGLQLAGGNTEEWFHFDLNGGLCENAAPAFRAFLKSRYPDEAFPGLPDLSPLRGTGTFHRDVLLARFLEFANTAVAELICRLCRAAKEEMNGRLAVGTFYGYSPEVASPLWGTHALQTLLACPDVDFICSPNSYVGTRDPAADWPEMYPADSVRLHGKLCMQECDIRTHLTLPLSEVAPEFDPHRRYTAPIWQPLKDREASIDALRKTFCRQFVKSNGFWWFDMWGGWYRDPVLMAQLGQMRTLYAEQDAGEERGAAELAAFTDESAYRYFTDHPLRGAAFRQRTALGFLGAPWDLFDVFDFEAVFQKYRAVVFLSAADTPPMRRALALCTERGLQYLAVSAAKPYYTPAELRAFCDAAGVHVWCRTDDVMYVNHRHLALHATGAGEKTVFLDGPRAYRELLAEDGIEGSGETLRLTMRAGETRLFELSAP